MLRTFAEHVVRPVRSLDGLWSFLPECDQVPRGKVPKTFSRRIEVPSAWETIPDLRGYRGIGWFQRPIECSGQKHLRLRFGGVSHTATVWLDGKEIGQHYDAFTPWDLVIPKPKAGAHTLTLKVDNRFTEESSLHIPNDYYTYGGITRPVELQEVPDLFVEKLLLTPLRAGNGWDLDVRVRLRNLGEKALGGSLRARVADTEGESELAPVPAGARKEIRFRMAGLAVREWNEFDPALYNFRIELWQDGVLADDLIDRVGFRTVEVRGAEILYNGKPLRLRGFNRHEDHPMYGCAIPPAGMAHDLALIEDMNANFIRTCHYPNDMRFLDMCDERGFYVWEESHSRQTPFDNPHFMRQISDSNVEMVENHYNHPCIIMWGSLNECDTESKAGYKAYKAVLAHLRKLDPTRPVTYAANRCDRDRCLGLSDIVSWNFYTGWYGDKPEDTLTFFERMLAWLDSPKSAGGAGKPIIISEFGGGGIRGWRHPHGHMWTEEGQSHLLDHNLSVYLHHPRIVGAAIWQFSDVRVTPERNPKNGYSPLGRPRCMNNKGIVDEFRQPKLAYATVKAHFAKAARKKGG